MRQNAKTRHCPLRAAPPPPKTEALEAPLHTGAPSPSPHLPTGPFQGDVACGGRGAGGRPAWCPISTSMAPLHRRQHGAPGTWTRPRAETLWGEPTAWAAGRLCRRPRGCTCRHAKDTHEHAAHTRTCVSPSHTCACSQDTRAPAPRLHSGTRADTRANTPRTHRHTRRPATQTRTSRRPRGPACWGAHAVTCAGTPCSPHSPHTLRHARTPMRRHMRPYTAPAAGAGEGGRPGWGQLRRRPAAGPAMDGGWWACRALDRRRDPRDVVGAGVGLARPRLRPPAGGSGLRGRRTRLGNGHPQPRGRSQARWPSGQPHRSARPSPSEPIRPWAPVWPLCPPPKRAAQPGSVPSSRCLW